MQMSRLLRKIQARRPLRLALTALILLAGVAFATIQIIKAASAGKFHATKTEVRALPPPMVVFVSYVGPEGSVNANASLLLAHGAVMRLGSGASPFIEKYRLEKDFTYASNSPLTWRGDIQQPDVVVSDHYKVNVFRPEPTWWFMPLNRSAPAPTPSDTLLLGSIRFGISENSPSDIDTVVTPTFRSFMAIVADTSAFDAAQLEGKPFDLSHQSVTLIDISQEKVVLVNSQYTHVSSATGSEQFAQTVTFREVSGDDIGGNIFLSPANEAAEDDSGYFVTAEITFTAYTWLNAVGSIGGVFLLCITLIALLVGYPSFETHGIVQRCFEHQKPADVEKRNWHGNTSVSGFQSSSTPVPPMTAAQCRRSESRPHLDPYLVAHRESLLDVSVFAAAPRTDITPPAYSEYPARSMHPSAFDARWPNTQAKSPP
ncbi:hypothetical protein THASP1DRAFT_28914 [Thamnocephalis sphaerospora]|uniref:Uncharacterized protein n=1 Tax=Thamnocephalis sphaerospora TaxID=78915 RepID=A0A4V1IWZ6_9FUNG|nr:hypothetical protein THASP1DRAFT_28914 [Thamnocephalis sphaerospora]|eukprot:RKP09289.1 hypothetical protein THASP1DRAFT_28914 [Thamnocephalis sphaerospora]